VRFTKKQLANIAVVTVVGLIATGWAVFGLMHVRFDSPKTVRVLLASSGGALPGAEVTYLGVPIGRVSSAHLVPDALELTLAIRPKGPMPRELRAVVRQKTALGEPYVDLMPASPDAPPGDPDGAVVPKDRTEVPRSLDQLLEQADRILSNVQPRDLTTLVEGGSALAGHEDDLKAITASGARIGDVLARRRAQLGDLLSSSATLVNAHDRHRDALASSLSSGARVADVFARHTQDLAQILATGADVGANGSAFLSRTRAAWPGVLAGLDASTHNLADRPTKTDEILTMVPPYLQGISRTFSEGLAWSSNGGLPGMPVQPLYAVPLTGKGLEIEHIFTPAIVGRIRADFSGSDPGAALLFITPDQFRRASESPEAYQQVVDEALAKLAERGKEFRPAPPGSQDLDALDLRGGAG
jgi:phospholipid/cholesterol/gamma-HCH transport system substrate-binding protein